MGLEKGNLKKMDIYDQIIEKHGCENQLRKTLGELAEFAVEVNKCIERRGVRSELMSEMADVYNMLRQVRRMYAIPSREIWTEMRRKMIKAVGEQTDECTICIYQEPADCKECEFGGGQKYE